MRREIIDVQRFGDRLDVIAPNPAVGRSVVEKALRGGGLTVDIYREDQPTLENTFVATLRAAGQELKAPPYPGLHDHGDLRGKIAIGATNPKVDVIICFSEDCLLKLCSDISFVFGENRTVKEVERKWPSAGIEAI